MSMTAKDAAISLRTAFMKDEQLPRVLYISKEGYQTSLPGFPERSLISKTSPDHRN
jgi:hypothetical protein